MSTAPAVSQLMEENAELKQHIVQLTASLRAHEATAAASGNTESFVNEISLLSDAIKSLRDSSRAETARQAQQLAAKSISLHEKQRAEDDDDGTTTTMSSRLVRIEKEMLSDAERQALHAQREKLKRSIAENFGADRVEALVEEEVLKRRRAKVGTTVASSYASNTNSASSAPNSPSRFTTLSASAVSAETRQSIREFNAAHTTPTAQRVKADLAEKAERQRMEVESVHRARDDAMRRAAEEEEYLHDIATPLRPLESVPRISREREEQQQMIISNATPLRAAMLAAQEKAMMALKRDLEDEEEAMKGSVERRGLHDKRKEQLAQLEKQHAESVRRGIEQAAAIGV